MATITAVAGGGTWATTGTWDSGTVPTAADDVVLGASSGAVTIGAAAACRSLDASAYTSTLTHNAAVTLTIGDATAGTGNSALKLGSGMTYALGNATTSAISFVSTSTTQQSITTAGKTLGNLTFSGSGGTWLFADAVTSTGAILVSAGALATGSQAITCLTFGVNGTSPSAAIGTSTLNLTSTTSNANLFLRASGGTFTAGAATLNVVNAATVNRNIAPQTSGLSSATINYTVNGSTGSLTFVGGGGIGTLNFSDASNARTVIFPASTTYTIFGTLNIVGSAAGAMTVKSSTGATTATLTKSSGFVSCDYLSLQDITVTGGCSWYAGANSAVVSNVSGWFLTPPSNSQMAAYFGGVL
jgi:hypothetical protein